MIQITTGKFSKDVINVFSKHSTLSDIDNDYEPVIVTSKPVYSIKAKIVRMFVLGLGIYLMSSLILPNLMNILDKTELFSFSSYSYSVLASTFCSVFLFGFTLNTFDSELIITGADSSEKEIAGKSKSENF